MNARDWHPVQLGLFWILIVLFGFPLWIGLSIVGDFLSRWLDARPARARN
jgi:hypothetical protein